MRIIIEVDSNSQTEIKKIASPDTELQGNYLSATSSSALDAGFANIPEPEIIHATENEISVTDMKMASNDEKAIDAGAFTATQSGDDSDMIISSSHQNELTMAVSSGSAVDAGIAKLPGEESGEVTFTLAETAASIFDRSNAISGGEFINPDNGLN
ncbi:MAG: hypothetical protein H7Z13_00120 [Ferruginibacter sp.]|nr:hypothetical protein [Ferruginibacter sp.]